MRLRHRAGLLRPAPGAGDGRGVRGHAGILSRGGQVPPGRAPPLPRLLLSRRDPEARGRCPGLRQAADGRRHAPGRGSGGPGGGGRPARDRRPDAEPGPPARDPVRDPPGRPEEQDRRPALRKPPGPPRAGAAAPRYASAGRHRTRRVASRRRGRLPPAERGGDPGRRLRRRVRHDPPVPGRRAAPAYPRGAALPGGGRGGFAAEPVRSIARGRATSDRSARRPRSFADGFAARAIRSLGRGDGPARDRLAGRTGRRAAPNGKSSIPLPKSGPGGAGPRLPRRSCGRTGRGTGPDRNGAVPRPRCG